MSLLSYSANFGASRLYNSELIKKSFSLIPGEQQLLFELATKSDDFYVIFQRENHFINKRLQKLRLNLKCMSIMSIKQTEIGTHGLENFM
jgi:hypothetical protein